MFLPELRDCFIMESLLVTGGFHRIASSPTPALPCLTKSPATWCRSLLQHLFAHVRFRAFRRGSNAMVVDVAALFDLAHHRGQPGARK